MATRGPIRRYSVAVSSNSEQHHEHIVALYWVEIALSVDCPLKRWRQRIRKASKNPSGNLRWACQDSPVVLLQIPQAWILGEELYFSNVPKLLVNCVFTLWIVVIEIHRNFLLLGTRLTFFFQFKIFWFFGMEFHDYYGFQLWSGGFLFIIFERGFVGGPGNGDLST